MSNALNGAWIIAILLAGVVYFLDIGGIRTDKEKNAVYQCQDKSTNEIYHSRRVVSGDNCTPISALNINPDIVAGIRD